VGWDIATKAGILLDVRRCSCLKRGFLTSKGRQLHETGKRHCYDGISTTMIFFRLLALRDLCCPIRRAGILVDKVDAEEMQYHTSKHEIRKCSEGWLVYPVMVIVGARRLHIPLMAPSLKLDFVLGRCLHPQTDSKHELTNRGRETGKEGVERLSMVSKALSNLFKYPRSHQSIHFS